MHNVTSSTSLTIPVVNGGSSSQTTVSRYGAISQPGNHVAISIGADLQDAPLPPLTMAYHALQGGLLGGVISGTLAYAAAILASDAGYGGLVVTAGASTLAILGASAGAAVRVNQKVQDREFELRDKIRAYRDAVCMNWDDDPGKKCFDYWFDRMTDPESSLEFTRRPEHVMATLREILDAAAANERLRLGVQEIAWHMMADCHDRVSMGMVKMLDEVRTAKMLERGASAEEFVERGKVSHCEYILVQVAAEISANPAPTPLFLIRPSNFQRESLELFMYFAQALGPEFGMKETVKNPRYASMYGSTCGYTLDQVRARVRDAVNAEGAFQSFMKTDCVSWRCYLSEVKSACFQAVDGHFTQRLEMIDMMYDGDAVAPHVDKGLPKNVMKEMHKQLAVTNRSDNRSKLYSALTDHYFDKKTLDSFDFNDWMDKEQDSYAALEQKFIANPEQFAYLRESAAGSLIGL